MLQLWLKAVNKTASMTQQHSGRMCFNDRDISIWWKTTFTTFLLLMLHSADYLRHFVPSWDPVSKMECINHNNDHFILPAVYHERLKQLNRHFWVKFSDKLSPTQLWRSLQWKQSSNVQRHVTTSLDRSVAFPASHFEGYKFSQILAGHSLWYR